MSEVLDIGGDIVAGILFIILIAGVLYFERRSQKKKGTVWDTKKWHKHESDYNCFYDSDDDE